MSGSEQERITSRCFVALPQSPEFEATRVAVIKGAEEARFRVILWGEDRFSPGSTIGETLAGDLARADCIVADLTGRDPNVFLELGMAQAMGKGLILISREGALDDIPFDVRHFRVATYSPTARGLAVLTRKVSLSLREFRRSPRASRQMSGFRSAAPFFVEWRRLSSAEVANLCRELLSQMGFRGLNWDMESEAFDLVAELPRKDPDGFEYRELWFIAMGQKAPPEALLEMLSEGSELSLLRLLRDPDRLLQLQARSSLEAPVTILLILLEDSPDMARLERSREMIQRRLTRRLTSGVRVRIWDQAYLTRLVQQFPQIGYKYFSDEARVRSKTRKSYEELYRENAEILTRETSLRAELEAEKNRRVTAERDAVWKDISFSAAHKIGNPIFAIETDLDPLGRRIREGRTGEAETVIANIRSSVEKAKAFVGQFKSLARSQELRLAPILLRPILDDACRQAVSQGVACLVSCPSDFMVIGDAERLSESFEELYVNATHWFDKRQKKIDIQVVHPLQPPLPRSLDSGQDYALVHFKDNGCGISVENKARVFDAFFTTHEHGTGLGLALVRRVIEGHGGVILESGIPKQGADFEIYLRTQPTQLDRSATPASQG